MNTRITVGLIPKVEADLASLSTDLGMSKADIINRAITLYRFVQDELGAGGGILVQDTAGEVERIRLL